MSTFEIFSDVLSIAEALMEVKKTLHNKGDIAAAIVDLEEKAIAPIKDICKKISKLLHFHIGHGEQKLSELEGALDIKGAKDMLAKHEKLMEKGNKCLFSIERKKRKAAVKAFYLWGEIVRGFFINAWSRCFKIDRLVMNSSSFTLKMILDLLGAALSMIQGLWVSWRG